MARDLHDTVSQQLFAMHMSASSLPRLLEMNPEQGHNVLDQLIQMSHIAQRQMRGLLHSFGQSSWRDVISPPHWIAGFLIIVDRMASKV